MVLAATNRSFCAAIGVDLVGHQDVLGLCAGNGGGESAKFWLQVLSELKNRGIEDETGMMIALNYLT